MLTNLFPNLNNFLSDVDLCNPNNCNIDEVCHQIGSRFECRLVSK